MSFQGNPSSSRVIRSSPNTSKQGPLKAVIPVSSFVRHGSNLKTNVSPTANWKNCRISPDQSLGQRSPGSSFYKVKSKTLDNAGNIRRTASLDTLYLKGQWPRDNFYWHSETLQINKATQTDDLDWIDPRKIPSVSECSEEWVETKTRQRLRSNKESVSQNSSSQTLASCILSPTMKANPVNIPLKPLPKSSIRSSVEGLNQEIERLVLKTSSSGSQCSDKNEEFNKFSQVTPEGHRAPLAEIFRSTRSRSVNTQTPVAGDPTGSCYSSGESNGSSPDQESYRLGTSPHINRFFAREPPDGCERVHLKSLEEFKTIPLENAPQPCNFKLKPSLGSAFQLLKPNNLSSEQEIPIVPSQQNLI